MLTTSDVLIELSARPLSARCCRRAELAAVLRFAGFLSGTDGHVVVSADFDSLWLAQRMAAVLGQTSMTRLDTPTTAASRRRDPRRHTVVLARDDQHLAELSGLLDPGRRPMLAQPRWGKLDRCDVKSLWRGAFLARGRLRRMAAMQVVEVRCPDAGATTTLVDLAHALGVRVKQRRFCGSPVVIVKDPDSVRTLLRRIGAPHCAAELSLPPTVLCRSRADAVLTELS